MSTTSITNRLTRSSLLVPLTALGIAVAVTSGWSLPAAAQTYPSRPISLIVPFPPGGPADTPTRVIAERMRKALGQSVVIENIGGASGSIGAARGARAAADGYTIVLGNLSTHVMNAVLYTLPYDVLNDFAPISPLVTAPVVLYARKSLPASNVGELIGWLKANPGKASAGYATVAFQAVDAFFMKETGTQFTLIPYRGSAPGMQDLIAGTIDLYFTTPNDLALARAGSIKAFAVTSDVRLATAPEIPTFAELGMPSITFANWYGFFAPKGTPTDVIARLNAAVAETLADPAVKARIVDFGMDIYPSDRLNPSALRALQSNDIQKWWPIAKEFGLKGE